MITATEMRNLTDACKPIIERRCKDEVEAAKNVVLDRCRTRARHAATQGQNSTYVEMVGTFRIINGFNDEEVEEIRRYVVNCLTASGFKVRKSWFSRNADIEFSW